MNIFNELKQDIHTIIHTVFPTVFSNASDATLSRLTVEPPRDSTHGDAATNAAMIISKDVGQPPRVIAEAIKAELEKIADITEVTIAGPGFINLRLSPARFAAIIPHSLTQGPDNFGNSNLGQGREVNVEYVSANPTGPLTVGHARGAIFGDALANLLAKSGYNVNREYYTNDAGRQVDVLTDSVILRIREQLGETITIPDGCYPGEYLKDVAQAYVRTHGDNFDNRQEIKDFSINFLMDEIKADLHALNIHHDIFVSEDKILQSGAVQKALQQLTDLGLIYEGVLEAPKGKTPDDWEPRPQTLFRSTDFGDDVDRALLKSDGSTTYFANDIAHFYHMYKMGYTTLIGVLGADHGGYVKRAKAAVRAITQQQATLDLPLMAMVSVTENGQPVRMSKRAGTFITLRDMIDRVGAGVIRFIMLTREAGQTLEFDYAKVTEQSKDNPYFYVQYAHARTVSVMRSATETFGDIKTDTLLSADLTKLTSPEETTLIKRIATWPRIVEQAAFAQEPHRIAYFAADLAAAFHSWWQSGRSDANMRFIVTDDKPITLARLALLNSVAITLKSALGIIGVPALDELRSDMEDAA